MRVRDRLVVAVLVTLALVGGMWELLVSPERNQVTSLSGQIVSERAALASAELQVSSARRAAIAYTSHLAQISQVMRAVPPVAGEAQLVATIDRLTGTKIEPDFRELDVGTDAATASGPESVGLTFTFWTTYSGLQKFLAALDSLTATDGSNVNVSGRLFTVTSVVLAPLGLNGVPSDVTKATIEADAYLQSSPAAAVPTTGATGPTG
jgi:hypothetical protein